MPSAMARWFDVVVIFLKGIVMLHSMLVILTHVKKEYSNGKKLLC